MSALEKNNEVLHQSLKVSVDKYQAMSLEYARKFEELQQAALSRSERDTAKDVLRDAVIHVKSMTLRLEDKAQQVTELEEELADRESCIRQLVQQNLELRDTLESMTDRCHVLMAENKIYKEKADVQRALADSVKSSNENFASRRASDGPIFGLPLPREDNSTSVASTFISPVSGMVGTLESIRPMIDMVNSLEKIRTRNALLPSLPHTRTLCLLDPKGTPTLRAIRGAYVDECFLEEVHGSGKDHAAISQDEDEAEQDRAKFYEKLDQRSTDLESYASNLSAQCRSPSLVGFGYRAQQIERRSRELQERLKQIHVEQNTASILHGSEHSDQGFWKHQLGDALQRAEYWNDARVAPLE